MTRLSASDQQGISMLLQNLTGTIGEFQSDHFIIARDEEEIKLMSCYGFLDNESRVKFARNGVPNSPEEPDQGIFYLVRRRIDISAALDSLTSAIHHWEQEQYACLQPRKEKIQSLEQQAAVAAAKAAKTRIFTSFFREDYLHAQKKLREDIRNEKENIRQEDKWSEDIELCGHRIQFYQHLGQRYGQDTVTVLEHSGWRNAKATDHPLHDGRGVRTYFTLFGKESTTKVLFDLASRRAKGNFIPLLWELCRQTPYMGHPAGEILKYDPQRNKRLNSAGYREGSYQLFDQVRQFRLYDAIERKKVFLTQR